MGQKRASKRIRKIQNGIRKYIWIPFMYPLFEISRFLLGFIRDEFASALFGGKMIASIEYFVKEIFCWIQDNPAGFSAIWFFFTLSSVIAFVFWQTKDPFGLLVEQSIGENSDGIILRNETGGHLLDYMAWIVNIDDVPCFYKVIPINKEISGTRDFYKSVKQVQQVQNSSSRRIQEFINSTSIELKIEALPIKLEKLNIKKVIGTHTVDLKFQAFDKKDKPIEMFIYADVLVVENENKDITLKIVNVAT